VLACKREFSAIIKKMETGKDSLFQLSESDGVNLSPLIKDNIKDNSKLKELEKLDIEALVYQGRQGKEVSEESSEKLRKIPEALFVAFDLDGTLVYQDYMNGNGEDKCYPGIKDFMERLSKWKESKDKSLSFCFYTSRLSEESVKQALEVIKGEIEEHLFEELFGETPLVLYSKEFNPQQPAYKPLLPNMILVDDSRADEWPLDFLGPNDKAVRIRIPGILSSRQEVWQVLPSLIEKGVEKLRKTPKVS